jgi:replication-associated recombination protein RarA
MQHNQKINNKLDSFLKNERIPHIIFYGPPGSGKKTILSRFLKAIYGNEAKMYSNVMFVNCAHSKGIKFIREELKFFAKTNTQLNTGIQFKSIVLLNAEHLTVDAQSAMRRCIEQFSINTRFFIVITNKNKLLIPILSRFCEIYVPSSIDAGGNDINLHNPQKIIDADFQTTRKEMLMDMMEKLEENHLDMVNVSSELYENAFSAVDIMEWMKQNDERWTILEKANIGMCFMKAKSEFRCEKLLMLFMLDFMFFHSTQELKTLSFM